MGESSDTGTPAGDQENSPLESDRLLSWEFILYWLVSLYALLVLVYAALDTSWKIDDRRPGIVSLHARLGLVRYMHYSQDLSDTEWKLLRSIAAEMAFVMAIYTLLGQLMAGWGLCSRKTYFLLAGIAYVGYLHEGFAVIIFVAAGVNYLTANAVAGKSYGVAVIWAIGIGTLVCGRALAAIGVGWGSHPHPLGRILADWGGRVPWQLPLPMLTLRVMSFGLDLHRMRTGRGGSSGADIPASGSTADLKARLDHVLPTPCYDAAHYCAYVFYPPLYLVGPLLTFKSFASQTRSPKVTPLWKAILYGAGAIAAGAGLELLTCVVYLPSLARTGLWRSMHRQAGFALEGDRLLSIALFSLLAFVLKWTALWRSARFFALMGGIGAPENVRRRLFSMASFQVVWRNWHASYNRWLVRYLYLPLRGRSRKARNVCVALAFSAACFWSGFESLSWALCSCVAICIEMALQSKGVGQSNRHVAAVMTGCNIVAISCVSLVAFVTGGSGTVELLQALWGSPRCVAVTLAALFSVSQIINEISARELPMKSAPSN